MKLRSMVIAAYKDLPDQTAYTQVNVAKIVQLFLFLRVSKNTHFVQFSVNIIRIERKFEANLQFSAN